MPSEKISEARVDVTADISDVQAKVSTLEGEFEKTGEAADRAGGRISAGVGKANGAVDRIGRSMSRVQETFSKLVIPVLFITGVTALVDKVARLRRDSEAFKDNIKDAAGPLVDQRSAALQDEALTRLQSRLVEINSAADAAEEQLRKLFESQQGSAGVLAREIESAFQNLTGIDLGLKSQDEIFESIEDGVKRIRKAQQDLVAEATSQARKAVEEARQDFAARAVELAASQDDLRIAQLKEAGDFLAASELELRNQRIRSTAQLAQLTKEVKEATKDLGGELQAIGDTLIAQFKRVSEAERQALRDQAEEAQRQYFQPFLDALRGQGGSNITTRLDTLIAELQQLNSQTGRR